MNSSCIFQGKHNHRAFSFILFSLVWLCGIFGGINVALTNSDFYISLMRSVITKPVSIVGLLVSVFLPLLLSFLLFVSCKSAWFSLVCFYKAVSYGFSGMLLSIMFGSAGWLSRMLFLFSDTVGIVLLFWFWVRRVIFSNEKLMVDTYTYLCIAMITAGFDRLFISPLIMGLF